MDANTLLRLERLICRGNFDCLKNCCSSGNVPSVIDELSVVFKTLQTQEDLEIFKQMLCSPCSGGGGGSSPSPTPPGPTPPVTPPVDENCASKAIKLICSPVTTSAATAVLAAASLARAFVRGTEYEDPAWAVQTAMSMLISGCGGSTITPMPGSPADLFNKLCPAYNKLKASGKTEAWATQLLAALDNLYSTPLAAVPGFPTLKTVKDVMDWCCGSPKGFTIDLVQPPTGQPYRRTGQPYRRYPY